MYGVPGNFWQSPAAMELNAQAVAQRNQAIKNGNEWRGYAQRLEAENEALKKQLSQLKTEKNMMSATLSGMKQRVAELKARLGVYA